MLLVVQLYQTYSLRQTLLVGDSTVDIAKLVTGTNNIWVPIHPPKEFADNNVGTTGEIHLLVDKPAHYEQGMLKHYGIVQEVIPIRLQAGDIVLLNTNYLHGNATKVLTFSEWDHIGMVIQTPKKKLKFFEAIPEGVHLFGLNNRLKYYHKSAKIGIRRLQLIRDDDMIHQWYTFAQEVKGYKLCLFSFICCRQTIQTIVQSHGICASAKYI